MYRLPEWDCELRDWIGDGVVRSEMTALSEGEFGLNVGSIVGLHDGLEGFIVGSWVGDDVICVLDSCILSMTTTR